MHTLAVVLPLLLLALTLQQFCKLPVLTCQLNGAGSQRSGFLEAVAGTTSYSCQIKVEFNWPRKLLQRVFHRLGLDKRSTATS